MKTALIVIDVQQSFTRRPYWQDLDVAAFNANLQHLIDDCTAKSIPVVQIFHVDEAGGAANPFSMGSGFVQTLPGITINPDIVFYKTVHSSLFGKDVSGQTLEAWLAANGIEEVLITGIRTEQCCETTTRHASDLGYQVRFVTDATLTFPMTHASGRQYSAQEIRERTELVLSGRFAKIVSAQAAFA
ncbi:MAG: isochorismatase family protein [Burkholderiaceae bacterium]